MRNFHAPVFARSWARPWNLINELDSLWSDEDNNNKVFATEQALFYPAVDVEEGESSYRLSIDLPGIAEKDVSLSIEGNVLTVRGGRRSESQTEKGKVYRSERKFGEFMRAFTLPDSADAEKIDAKFKEGVLTIDIPKAAQAKSRQIMINKSKS